MEAYCKNNRDWMFVMKWYGGWARIRQRGRTLFFCKTALIMENFCQWKLIQHILINQCHQWMFLISFFDLEIDELWIISESKITLNCVSRQSNMSSSIDSAPLPPPPPSNAIMIGIDFWVSMSAQSLFCNQVPHGTHAEVRFLHSCHSLHVVNYSLCPSVVEMSQECTPQTDKHCVSDSLWLLHGQPDRSNLFHVHNLCLRHFYLDRYFKQFVSWLMFLKMAFWKITKIVFSLHWIIDYHLTMIVHYIESWGFTSAPLYSINLHTNNIINIASTLTPTHRLHRLLWTSQWSEDTSCHPVTYHAIGLFSHHLCDSSQWVCGLI